MKLAIVATHPIQYHVPWFRALAAAPNVDLRVYYALLPDPERQGVGFGLPFTWDIPLLDGYTWELLPNGKRNPTLRGFGGSTIPAIRDRLHAQRPDAVIVTGWNAAPLVQAYWTTRRQGIPCVMRGESNALKPRPPWISMAQRAYLRGCDAFLAIGQANREFYVERRIEPHRIFDTPYFVDNARFRRQAAIARRRRNELRAAWQVPSASMCYLFAGKLEPKKRMFDLLCAVDRAKQLGSDIHLLVAGAGKQLDEARRVAADRDLPVTFTGFLNQTAITDAYVASDCLVLPSDYGETWGLVVNEAMNCGLPAIVSNRVGCANDLVLDGRTGRVFPFGDSEALAQTLIDLAARRESSAALGSGALRHVERYSVERAVDGTLSALEFVTRSAVCAG